MTSHDANSADRATTTLGIWRLIEQFHRGEYTSLHYAQPADAAGSPRADYVVKVLSAEDETHWSEGRSQLVRETEAIRSVSHPNMIAVLDSRLMGEAPFIVLPRLEGCRLSTWIGDTYHQPYPVCLWWIRQALQALSALHVAGWIHGDVKPDNIMISPRGHLTLIDLGLAIRSGSSVDPKRFEGTLSYAAPEKRTGGALATPDADIFSLGVVYFQLLSRSRELGSEFRPNFSKLHDLQVPSAMVSLAKKMLAPIPADRPSAQDLIDRILKLEIETLGMHIQPDDHLRAA